MNAVSRRQFITLAARSACALALTGGAAALLARSRDTEGRWVLDADKCSACGLCEKECVRAKSAVVCRNDYDSCGYCRYCYGYEIKDNSAAESAMKSLETGGKPSPATRKAAAARVRVCPRDAISRTQVGEKQYEYVVDEDKCTGCGLCVKRCKSHGNGSLKLFVRQDRCKECNTCTIATACPATAIRRA